MIAVEEQLISNLSLFKHGTLWLPDDPSIVEGYNESIMKCYRIVAAENFDVDNYLPTTEIEIIDLKLESKLTNIWKIPYVSSFF